MTDGYVVFICYPVEDDRNTGLIMNIAMQKELRTESVFARTTSVRERKIEGLLVARNTHTPNDVTLARLTVGNHGNDFVYPRCGRLEVYLSLSHRCLTQARTTANSPPIHIQKKKCDARFTIRIDLSRTRDI